MFHISFYKPSILKNITKKQLKIKFRLSEGLEINENYEIEYKTIQNDTAYHNRLYECILESSI